VDLFIFSFFDKHSLKLVASYRGELEHNSIRGCRKIGQDVCFQKRKPVIFSYDSRHNNQIVKRHKKLHDLPLILAIPNNC
jgi:hypothetical protein